MGSINYKWGQNDESQGQCSFAGKLQAAGKLQVCSRITFASKTTRATELQVWEGIAGGRKSQAAGKSLRVHGEMHEWEEITEPAKVQEWERFPSAGKLQSAVKLQFCEEFAKVRKTTKSSWQQLPNFEPRSKPTNFAAFSEPQMTILIVSSIGFYKSER